MYCISVCYSFKKNTKRKRKNIYLFFAYFNFYMKKHSMCKYFDILYVWYSVLCTLHSVLSTLYSSGFTLQSLHLSTVDCTPPDPKCSAVLALDPGSLVLMPKGGGKGGWRGAEKRPKKVVLEVAQRRKHSFRAISIIYPDSVSTSLFIIFIIPSLARGMFY